MPCIATTVMIQRLSVPDLSSLTDRTNPVTVAPIKFSVAFWPRYWAKRARLASIGSVVSMVCMLVPVVAVRETIPRQGQAISETLSNDSGETRSASERSDASRGRDSRSPWALTSPVS
jgi:hypothetical protein